MPLTVVRCDLDIADPFERGRLLGARFGGDVRRAIDDYDGLFAALGMRVDARSVADGAAALVREWAPWLADEVEGWAAGADLPSWRLWMLNARTELMAVARASANECSASVFVPTDGAPPRTVQTWDWIESMAQRALILSLAVPGTRRIRTFTEFGVLGKIGVNDAGLGLHFNILRHASDGAHAGVPVHVVARRVLEEAASIDDVLDLVRTVPLAASSVFTVATWRDGAAAGGWVELSPAGIGVHRAEPGGAALHTNLFLDPVLALDEGSLDSRTSRPRLRALAHGMEGLALESSFDRARSLAVDPVTGAPSPVCATPEQGAPAHDRWETKLTIALDVAGFALEYGVGGPDAVDATNWMRVDDGPT